MTNLLRRFVGPRPGPLLAGLFLAAAMIGDRLAAADRPNIILILADDLGYGDLACYGHPKFKTPALDRLAAEGARLTQFNCPAPVCAPTRGALMTGRYPFRCGMTQNPTPDAGPERDAQHLPETEITLPQLLQHAGYATGMVGKWHLGHARPEWLPHRRGFDEYFGIPYSNDMRPVQVLENERRAEYPVVQATLTERYTERALDFIGRSHRQQRPFFLYFAHLLVHKPLAVAEGFYRKSGNGLYADGVAELDASTGRILARLRELGIDRNTLVIFSSDNGPWWGGSTGGLRGMKGGSYEGGYRVPCLARWPGRIPAGHVSSEPAVMMDLFATVLGAAGVPLPKDRTIDGRDILPLFTSAAASPHEFIFGHAGVPLSTIRDARWKLHVLPPRDPYHIVGRTYEDPRAPDGVTIIAPPEQYGPAEFPGAATGVAPKAMQLFDLAADPAEQRDVAAENPAVVARLKRAFDAMAREAPRP